MNEGLVSVRFIESAKTATSRRFKTHVHNIFLMNIIIIGLSCNIFKCPAKMSRVSCINFYSGWQVCLWIDRVDKLRVFTAQLKQVH